MLLSLCDEIEKKRVGFSPSLTRKCKMLELVLETPYLDNR